MSNLDSQQVTLQLTNIKYILAELRKKKRLIKDENGEDLFQIQFDSRTIDFRPGRTVTVGKTIADCLIQDAFVIVGDAIDGPAEQVLEVVREFNLSEGEKPVTPTTCLFCQEDLLTPRALAEHLIKTHNDDDQYGNENAAQSSSHIPARSARAVPAKASKSSDANAL